MPRMPEQPDADMPEGWASAKIVDLLDIKYGKGLKADTRKRGKVAVYGSNGVVGENDTAITSGPTVIIGRKGTVGAVHWSPLPCWPIDTTYFIDDFQGLHGPFLYHAFRTLGLSGLDTSSAIPGLNRADIYRQLLPLPPLAEQKRIVAKVEELLARVNAARERLAKLPALLKRFRQAVLAAACSGRLTEEWRERHQCANSDKTANEADLPASWNLVTFGQLISDGPQNGLYKPASFYGDGTLIVRIDAFYDGQIAAWHELKRVRLTDKERRQFALQNDDILVNRVNSPKFLGKAALVRVLTEPCVYESNMMRIRLDRTRVNPSYAILYLQSLQGLVELRKNAKHAVNQASINQKDVESAMFNLPPLPEQHEIVRRVERLFYLADSIEKQVVAGTARVEKLTQAILAKAFRGELVPQDPSDKPVCGSCGTKSWDAALPAGLPAGAGN